MAAEDISGRYAGNPAENYEKYFVPAIGAAVAREAVAAAAIRPGERVLDVACGTGFAARLAAEQVGPTGAAAGLDIHPAMLAVARSVTPAGTRIDWYEASAEQMPLADDSFDVVLCLMGLQFVGDKQAAVREMHRVLAPGGRVVIHVPGPTPPAFAAYAEALARHVDPAAARFVHAVFSMHDPDELRALLSGAGFDEIAIRTPTRTFDLPPPAEFLWQYAHSTPLAAAVGRASDEQRAALQRDVVAAWQGLVTGGDAKLTVDATIATARA